MNNLWINAQAQLNEIAGIIKLDKNISARLLVPDRIIRISIPVVMDNGKIKVFTGYRSQHNNCRGPYKGGIRYHPGVTEEEVMALSMWMTWKTACVGIPLGGGKGGVIADPKSLSVGELERLSRGYVKGIYKNIGENIDIPAPDVNTNGRIMDWMADEYRKLTGKSGQTVFTGKTLKNGGSLGREEATGQGGVYILRELLKSEKRNPRQIRMVIQGAGNVGAWFAKLAVSQLGCRVVAISDSRGGVYDPEGLDAEKVLMQKAKTGKLPGGKVISNEKLLELETDVLVPAALENVINEKNAKRINAEYIIEMANGPVTPEADAILNKRKIQVLPDILCNAGGVTVSYFEWLQNTKKQKWTARKVLSKLEPVMVEAFRQSKRMKEKYRTTWRMGAYANAVARVAQVIK